MRRRATHQDESADVDITPLLDIVFILLIFFIVTATFVAEDGFKPNVPEPNPPEEIELPVAQPMILTVKPNGLIDVDGTRVVDPRSTKPIIEEYYASNPDGVVLVSAMEESKAKDAITVVDLARSVKVGAKVVLTKAGPGALAE